MSASPVPSLTRSNFEKNVAALIEANQQALTAHTALAEYYGDAILGLTTLPSFWTRLKMALFPAFWPRVTESDMSRMLAVLHGRLAASISRALVLEMIGTEGDSQTEPGNAEERERVARLAEGPSKPFLAIPHSRSDLAMSEAQALADFIWGDAGFASFDFECDPAAAFTVGKRAPELNPPDVIMGIGESYYAAFAAAGYPKLVLKGALLKIARDRAKGAS